MVERTNKATGQKFWGCARFAKGGCGEIKNLNGSSSKYEDRTTADDFLNE